MPWRPTHPDDYPTLGWTVLDWINDYLAAPDRAEYEPFIPYPEQADFVLKFYEINPRTGRRRRRRGVISRPRGWGKSPFLAALALAEALAPVVPAGWDADGQPVGRPWSDVRTPWVGILAVSEAQTGNTWDPLLEMCQGPVLDEYRGLDPMDTFVSLPRGKIEKITSSARTIKGKRWVFAVLDQTEEWVKSNGGLNLFQKVKNNTAKVGGSFVESPNAFIPGEGSVAENSAAFWAAIQEGRTRDDGLHYDHREAPADTDMTERESLTLGLRVAYGDSSGHPDGCLLHEPPCPPGHVDLEPLIGTIWDTTSDPQESRSDFLNQVTHASDAWLSKPEWTACAAVTKVVADREKITLGFDGSRKRNRGVTDATALVGCRVSDGHIFEIEVWEQPKDAKQWRVPVELVDAKVRETFRKYRVVGFYADPARWETYIAKWESTWGAGLAVKATRDHPIEWWMTGGRERAAVLALKQFHDAVVDQELTHCGSSTLMRHILNARRRTKSGSSGVHIQKSHPDSINKIDAAIAATLAWQAFLDHLAKPVEPQKDMYVPKRIR